MKSNIDGRAKYTSSFKSTKPLNADLEEEEDY